MSELMPLSIVPTPRRSTTTGRTFPLRGWQLLMDPKMQTSDACLQMLNARTTALGGVPLAHVTEHRAGSPGTIVALPLGHPSARPYLSHLESPLPDLGSQGYLLRFVESEAGLTILALGSDELGVLYACTTLAQLIQSDGANPGAPDALVVHEASVTDWPAFKLRCIGILGAGSGEAVWEESPDPAAGYLDEVEPQVQWLAQHKINYATMRGLPAREPWRTEAREAASRLAAGYGIRIRQTFGTAINQEIRGHEWTGCVERGNAKYCWSAHDAHAGRAERLAREAAAMNLGIFGLHVIDAGGLADPECWSRRCARCRSVYGDDYARASSEQFLTYYRALKRHAPSARFEAVVYPYHYQWAVPGFPTTDLPGPGFLQGLGVGRRRDAGLGRLADTMRELSRKLPSDVLITFREAGSEEHQAAASIWGDHPLTSWVYFNRNHGWQGLWEPQQRFLRTWLRSHPNDYLYHAGLGLPGNTMEIRAAACAEYAWNTETPDAADSFTQTTRAYSVGGRRLSEFQKESLLPRVLKNMWADDWTRFNALFAENASLAYVADPLLATNLHHDGEAEEDPYLYLEEQANLFARAARDLDEHFACGEGRRPGKLGGRIALYLYPLVHAARAKGEIEATLSRAWGLAAKGDETRALDVLARLRTRLSELEANIHRAVSVSKSDERVVRRPSGRGARSTDSILTSYRPTGEAARLGRLGEAIAAGAVGDGLPLRLFLTDQPYLSDIQPGGSFRSVAIAIDFAERHDRTVTYGYATHVCAAPVVAGSMDIDPTEICVTVSVHLPNHAEPLASQTKTGRTHRGLWRPTRPFEFDLGVQFAENLAIRTSVHDPKGRKLGVLTVPLPSPTS